MGSNFGLAIFFLFFSPKWEKKGVLACPNFSECTARVKLELTDIRLAAADQAYKARAKAEGVTKTPSQRMKMPPSGGVNSATESTRGPSSLFILSERNILRRTTKFLIEWPPFECKYKISINSFYF